MSNLTWPKSRRENPVEFGPPLATDGRLILRSERPVESETEGRTQSRLMAVLSSCAHIAFMLFAITLTVGWCVVLGLAVRWAVNA